MRISDWSSDVCSSDLTLELEPVLRLLHRSSGKTNLVMLVDELMNADLVQERLAETIRYELCRAQDTFCDDSLGFMALRSDESRFGKGCGRTGRSRGSPDPYKKNKDTHQVKTIV